MSVTLIIGCMFSGKTTELLRRLRNCEIAGQQIALYKYSGDTRYSHNGAVYSHTGQHQDGIPVGTFENITVDLGIKVIGIDEGQFIGGLVEFCDREAGNGRHVIVSALDGDFRRDPFPSIAALVCKSERVIKLSAVCTLCKGSASFSRRLDSTVTVVEDIGGAAKYTAVCRACFTAEII
jgi:thymidine kinase